MTARKKPAGAFTPRPASHSSLSGHEGRARTRSQSSKGMLHFTARDARSSTFARVEVPSVRKALLALLVQGLLLEPLAPLAKLMGWTDADFADEKLRTN